MGRQPTRREVLRTGTGLGLVGLAGCEEGPSDTGDDSTSGGSPETETTTTAIAGYGDASAPLDSGGLGEASAFTVQTIWTAPRPARQAQRLHVSVRVRNTTDTKRATLVPLAVDDTYVAVNAVSIPGQTTVRTTFQLHPGKPGSHTLRVGSQSTSMTVKRYPEHFVETDGTDFVLDGKPVYFSGANAPGAYGPDPERGPVDEIVADAAAMDLDVIRGFAFCNGLGETCLQPDVGVYDERAFRELDYTIYQAKRHDLRLILALVNNFSAGGGMEQYSEWVTGEPDHDAFYTNSDVKAAFKDYIRQLLTRTNTYTGIEYRNDPTIMMWELANEPDLADNDGPLWKIQEWVEEMSSFVKSIDPNHLVSTGGQGFYDQARREDDDADRVYVRPAGTDFINNNQPDTIDACSFHLYPQNMSLSVDEGVQWIHQHIRDAHESIGKPVYCGEFGYRFPRKNASQERISEGRRRRARIYERFYSALDEGDANGALFWDLGGYNFEEGLLSFELDHQDESTTVYYPEDERALREIEAFTHRMALKSLRV